VKPDSICFVHYEQLTSRLTNDVSSMAEPVNWMLSALLRNLLALGGGFAMCFIISWKLSMLAFTTMAPIMHITAVYSRWSRELNRKRYALLAEANSSAAEALGNIRTVRAFSTEDVEIDRFKSKTLAAMRKGVGDSFAYAGAVAINDWLDLGASVLILWYFPSLCLPMPSNPFLFNIMKDRIQHALNSKGWFC
jgi:ABC-type multidrug transport system fused ATPase/permease subunit